MANFKRNKNGIYAPQEKCRGCGKPIHDEMESDEAQRKRSGRTTPLCAVCRVQREVSQEQLNKDAKKQAEREAKTEEKRISDIARRTQQVAPLSDTTKENRKSFNI